MAGGTFTDKNKKRPGAYINFKGAARPLTSVGTRGIASMPLSLPWGEENTLISVTAAELADGRSLTKTGFTAADGNIFLNSCLKNCYKLLVWRVNSGGTKAAATSGGLTVTARHFGSLGNGITVVVKANGTGFDVMTYLNGDLKDKQSRVGDIAGLKANDWVSFSGTGTLTATAGTALSGGTDGTVTASAFAPYFAVLKGEQFNTFGIPFATPDVGEAAELFIKSMRENTGKYIQGVVAGYDSDYEGIIKIKTNQGYKTETETVDAAGLVALVTGMTAGARINQSNVYRKIDGAVSIIGELTEEDDINDALDFGWLILTRRSDGTVVIEDDINSLHTFTPERPKDFSSNRVIRVLDEIGNTCKTVFEESYIGKVTNNDIGRSLYKGDLIEYCKKLQGMEALEGFDGANDIEVLASDKDGVTVNAGVQPTDCMKKLYATFNVR